MIERVKTFSQRLQEIMDIRNWKAIDLAKRTNLSEATVSQYRSGYAKPKDDKLIMIANALDVNPVWLMGLNVPMELNPVKGDLTYEEKELIRMFRNISDDQKVMIMGALRTAYEMKKGSSEHVSAS